MANLFGSLAEESIMVRVYLGVVPRSLYRVKDTWSSVLFLSYSINGIYISF